MILWITLALSAGALAMSVLACVIALGCMRRLGQLPALRVAVVAPRDHIDNCKVEGCPFCAVVEAMRAEAEGNGFGQWH